MRNVSSEFIELMKERRDFYSYAQITFIDGDALELSRTDFSISGNTITDGAGASGFPLGVAMAKQITLSIFNDDDQFSMYDFYKSVIVLYLKFDLSATTESIKIGTFTVTEPETRGTIIDIVATDSMYKTDIDYETGLTYPATLGALVRDSCLTCGVSLATTTFNNDDFIVQTQPENITHRNFIGYAAQIAGGNARINADNELEIITYDFSDFGTSGLDGGAFDNDSPYSTGDTADGGTFDDYTSGDSYDGGTFGDRDNIHVLYKFKNSPTVATDDVVISGIRITADDTVYLEGTTDYALDIDNPLTTGSEQEVVTLIGASIIGLKFRPFEADHIAYPLAEFGDLAYINDRKGNAYQTVITDVDFTFMGYTTLKCSAESPVRNSSKYLTEATKAYIAARENTQSAITAYDLAVQQLTDLMTLSFGVYPSYEELEDGSRIYYLHDKPTLEESTSIWKMTAGGLAIWDADAGEYVAGIDSSGNIVANVLSAIGINFSWARGGTLTLGGENNESGVLSILDSTNTQVGYWGNNGLAIKNVFVVDSDGNVRANSFTSSNATITGGSFNVETTNASTSVIKLSYSGYSSEFSPVQVYLTGTGSYATRLSNASLNCYDPNSVPMAQLSTLGLYLNNSSANNLARFTTSALNYYNSSGANVVIISGTSLSAFIQGLTCGNSSSYSGYALSVMGNGAVQNNFDVYGTFYAASGSIASSDRDIKHDISDLEIEFCKDFIMSLKPSRYKYNNGTSGRYHHGFIAQDVKESMGDDGWGLYCEVEIPEQLETTTSAETSEEATTVVEEAKTIAGLRYEELIAPMVKVIQQQQEKIDKLEATLEKVMAFIDYKEVESNGNTITTGQL